MDMNLIIQLALVGSMALLFWLAANAPARQSRLVAPSAPKRAVRGAAPGRPRPRPAPAHPQLSRQEAAPVDARLASIIEQLDTLEDSLGLPVGGYRETPNNKRKEISARIDADLQALQAKQKALQRKVQVIRRQLNDFDQARTALQLTARHTAQQFAQAATQESGNVLKTWDAMLAQTGQGLLAESKTWKPGFFQQISRRWTLPGYAAAAAEFANRDLQGYESSLLVATDRALAGTRHRLSSHCQRYLEQLQHLVKVTGAGQGKPQNRGASHLEQLLGGAPTGNLIALLIPDSPRWAVLGRPLNVYLPIVPELKASEIEAQVHGTGQLGAKDALPNKVAQTAHQLLMARTAEPRAQLSASLNRVFGALEKGASDELLRRHQLHMTEFGYWREEAVAAINNAKVMTTALKAAQAEFKQLRKQV